MIKLERKKLNSTFLVTKIIILLGIVLLTIYVRAKTIDTKYIIGYDSYYHYRMAMEILTYGHRPAWDWLAAWPTGQPVTHPPLFHYYLAYSYLLVKPFTNLSLYRWCIFSPIIPVVVGTILTYFAAKEISNSIGGIFAALIYAISPILVIRTMFGCADTDGFVIFFPSLLTLFWARAINAKTKMRRILLGSLIGFSLLLYQLTWLGYFYMFQLLFGYFVLYGVYLAMKKDKQETMKNLEIFVPFLVVFLIFGTMYDKDLIATLTPAYLKGFAQLGERFQIVGGINLPNVDLSVAELYKMDIGMMVSLFSFLLILGPLGAILSGVRIRKKRITYSMKYVLYLALWLIGTYSIIQAGGRFTLLFAVPMAIASGIFFGKAYEFFIEIKPRKEVFILMLFFSLFLVPVYATTHQMDRSAKVTDDWWSALQWINDNTPEDSVVVTWWDYGYWIQAIGQRAVIMDGGRYDIHWRVIKVGKVLETSDERIAMKEILGFPDIREILILRGHSVDKETAMREAMLEARGFKGNASRIYLIVCDRMLPTYSWISYFGTWDFFKKNGTAKRYDISGVYDIRDEDGIEYLYSTYLNKTISLKCDSSGNFYSYFKHEKGYTPITGTIYEKDGKYYYRYAPEGANITVVPMKKSTIRLDNKTYEDVPRFVIVLRNHTASNMLTRLYFYNGEGLRYFKLVKDFDTVKIYEVLDEPQENLNEGIIRL
jgi:asparagine N-glycosylation enzyme membrane subunit Stt3